MMSRNLCLAGMMGAGKTTVGRIVADRLARRLVDTDDELRNWTGKSIPELFAIHGEDGFRRLEHEVIREVARCTDLVVALGGGAVLRTDNVAALTLTGVIVHLDAPAEVLAARMSADEITDRPLIADTGGPDGAVDTSALVARLVARRTERAERYAEASQLAVDAARAPEDVADEIVTWAAGVGDVLTPSEHEQVMP